MLALGIYCCVSAGGAFQSIPPSPATLARFGHCCHCCCRYHAFPTHHPTPPHTELALALPVPYVWVALVGALGWVSRPLLFCILRPSLPDHALASQAGGRSTFPYHSASPKCTLCASDSAIIGCPDHYTRPITLPFYPAGWVWGFCWQCCVAGGLPS